MLVDRGGGLNSIGCRGIAVGTKTNSCRGDFWGCVDMERPNGAVDEKHIAMGGLTEIINIGLVRLVWCNFSEVHGVPRDGATHNLGDYCWDPGSI